MNNYTRQRKMKRNFRNEINGQKEKKNSTADLLNKLIHRWERRGERKEPKEMNGMGGIGKECNKFPYQDTHIHKLPPALSLSPISQLTTSLSLSHILDIGATVDDHFIMVWQMPHETALKKNKDSK